MKILVTGANGFLGRHVVRTLIERGHSVRAMVRPHADAAALLDVGGQVELFRADLRSSRNLADAFAGVEVLIHLAAQVAGDDEARFASTVLGTERLLDGMAAAGGARRLVVAGSAAVYDWESAGRVIDEASPVLGEGGTPDAARRLYDRDGYAVAKVWQERVARRATARHGWDLTVLRPGIIWGPGNTDLSAMVGPVVGPVQIVFGPTRELPLTHVANCAAAFAVAAEDPRTAGRSFNVVDSSGVTAWRYAGVSQRASGRRPVRLPVPSALGLAVARAAVAASRLLFGLGGKLPSLLVPARYQARFRCVRVDGTAIREGTSWRPELAFEAAAEHAFATTEPIPSLSLRRPPADL